MEIKLTEEEAKTFNSAIDLLGSLFSKSSGSSQDAVDNALYAMYNVLNFCSKSN